MLRKLLKYDMKSVARFWWIAAIIILALCVVGGVSLRGVNELYDALWASIQTNVEPFGGTALNALARTALSISFILSIVGIGIAVVGVELMIHIRYFKHLFTDEGYLTFTLPVSRKKIFFSKVANAFFWMLMTCLVICIGVAVMLCIVPSTASRETLLTDYYRTFESVFGGAPWHQWIFVGIWGIIGVVIGCVSLVLSPCAVYFCITLGSTVFKKAKLLGAIGTYLLMSLAVYFASQFISVVGFWFLGLGTLNILFNASYIGANILITLAFLLALVIYVTLAVFFYCLTLNILERKLNLA